jgi:ABC-type transport system involved in cytochrome c biogenesis permease subunit
MKKAFPILAVLSAVFLAYATYQALVVAPTDALQGDVYRIIYYPSDSIRVRSRPRL